jgi:hypothetical protein
MLACHYIVQSVERNMPSAFQQRNPLLSAIPAERSPYNLHTVTQTLNLHGEGSSNNQINCNLVVHE